MPAPRIVFVAHAATAATRRNAFPTPDELSDPVDLAATARLVLPEAGTALVAPCPAAQRTSEALGLAARIEPALRDLDVGRWVGSSLASIPPDDLAAWITEPRFDGHGGESIAALLLRVRTFLALQRSRAGTTVAITHGTVLRAAAIAALDAPPSTFWRIETPPLSVVILSSDGRRWTLRALETRPLTANG